MSRKRAIIVTAAVFLLVIAAILFQRFFSEPDSAVTTDFIMDTSVIQRVYGKNAEKAAQEVAQMLREFEAGYSMYLESSQIYKLNSAAGNGSVSLDADIFEFLKMAKSLSQKSLGAFDITIAPLTKLWDISSGKTAIPDDESIKNALLLVNADSLVLDESKMTAMLEKQGQAVDLGGIAKGFSCNFAEEIYRRNSVQYATLSIGGNVYCYGSKSDGSDFRIGIRNPRPEISENGYIATVDIKSGFVLATSGDYERYFDYGGKRYHHIIDPDTGYPAETDLISVTVICKDGAAADFLSTALFVLGSASLDKLSEIADFEYIAVDKNFNVYYSVGLSGKIEITDENYHSLND